ncbi:TetR family transcriptional regulator [Microbacterium sp. KUDC0406]|uniref:TetR/AcrR family transcriptional regulator n=1 Tax=Microbacterium sp. KUDC0406 TaxID=2909588 RepID=UPI001F29B09B|nr:TetR/AcrR family transcriptional regulator [Microbacterium sp. KUDC0406]UJP11337.1 TetR family transcriptional regulator [Microbacterium sp. KUDC0406]
MSREQPRRRYTSRLREQQASETRERIIRAAAELFASGGYAGTSLPQIARAADVSTETVQSHGPKIRLLHAAIDLLSFGTGDEGEVLDTDLGSRFRTAGSAADAARISAVILAEVNSRSHGLWLAFSEAARSDPELAASLRRLTESIREENLRVTGLWRSHGWLREDVPDVELARWGAVIGSVEVYDRVVRIEGAGLEAYRNLIARLMRELMVKD